MLWEILLVAILPYSIGYKSYNIGGLFEGGEGIESAFGISAMAVNKNRHIDLNLSMKYMQVYQINVDDDLWDVHSKVCELVQEGVVGIFGPQRKQSVHHVHSMCDAMGIPHIATTLNTDDSLKTINIYPHSKALSMIYYNLVVEYKWKTYTILYENDDSLIMMKPLLERWNATGYTVTIRRLIGPNYRNMLRAVKLSGEENIILDCSIEILTSVLEQSLQVGLLTEKFNLIITSLDLQTINYEPFQYSGMNITVLRLIDPNSTVVKNIIKNDFNGFGNVNMLTVNQALMFDAVQLFAHAFKEMDDIVKYIPPLPCDGTEVWEHGETLINYIRTVNLPDGMHGLTGLVKFDTAGYRSEFQLDILNLGEDGLTKIGVWNNTEPIKWISKPVVYQPQEQLSMQNITFRVLISLSRPYAWLKDSLTMRLGNDRFEGYAIDIIQELSNKLGFNYTFIVQEDKNYGVYNNTTGWNGMIGKIISNEADLAITDLTITEQREKDVDFTLPFMSFGISILFRKASKAEGSLMSFLSPLDNQVWLCLIAAYIFVSLELFIIGRICPGEWVNPYPCIDEPTELKNQLQFKNCLWFTLGALMQQGSEIAPAGISTRLLSGCWFFFCLIMVSTYTANLASSLTFEVPVLPFHNLVELANQNKIKYGAKKAGSTLAFFQGSNDSTYRQIYETMKNDAINCLLPSNEAGKEKVLREDFAFFMESSTVEYEIERNCNLTVIDRPFTEKGYGIAMRKNAPYRHDLSSAILELQETGILAQMKQHWWRQRNGGGSCEQVESGQPEELNLKNVGGVYLVLCIGVIISFLWTLTEMLLRIRVTSHEYNVPFKEQLMEELKYVFKFNSTTKPVRRKIASSRKSGISTTDCISIATSNTVCEESV
ncbi:glutamate receptor ionotropic, kainate 2-like [Leptopilina boulardi]|uniref:glutamate receptor ionotropic, kainate 2-like n=1 Tax=Leptopilina boulardi TaxID=63433 RepID=UPI0021F52D33|nr:glutamate receptor ionotropic, kainate 2-like [Leptopilina boulardi]